MPQIHVAQEVDVPDFKTPLVCNVQEVIPDKDLLNNRMVFGKKVEDFFAACINHHPYYSVYLQNIQIVEGKLTLGEIDFILRDRRDNSFVHVELATKFYIYDPDLHTNKGELPCWIGPNRRDTLLRKIQKIKQQQLPLLKKQFVLNKLSALGIDVDKLTQTVCFKALLFTPMGKKITQVSQLNPTCFAGHWVHFSEIGNFSDCRFFVPTKQNWLVNPNLCQKWISFSAMLVQLEKSMMLQKSPLIWYKNPHGVKQRLFVVWW